LGRVPRYEDLDWRGMENFTEDDFNRVMSIDKEAWKQEILSHEELFIKLYDRLPKELLAVRELLLSSLWSVPNWQGNQERE
jgi:phosphoenolpyruvate carboxykinase (GTP)